MGGKAFLQAAAEGKPTLNTPRMSPEMYERMKALCIERLQGYFQHDCDVMALKEAPEKPDYGDIDLMVCTEDFLDLKGIGKYLGAAGVIGGSAHRCSVAIPQDGSKHPGSPTIYKATGGPQSKRKPSEIVAEQDYVQVDIEFIRPDLFQWHTFYASYGDLAGLLGAIMHNLGFTVCDRGLYLRLQELDDAKDMQGVRVDNREGLLFLSANPATVMRYLGLSREKYEAGFATMHQFYAWLAESRFVTLEIHQFSKRKNSSKQRKKERKRTIIGNFFDEFLPEYLELEPHCEEDEFAGEEAPWPPPGLRKLRKKYRDDAVDFFGRFGDFKSMQISLRQWIQTQKAEQLVKPIIAEHSGKKEKKLAELVRAFRRRVIFDTDGVPYIATSAHTDQESELLSWLAEDESSLRDPEAVSEWVKENWEELKELERLPSDEALLRSCVSTDSERARAAEAERKARKYQDRDKIT